MDWPLLGKKCPICDNEFLDGRTIRLEKHLHREIVVIVSELDLSNPFQRPWLNAFDQFAKQYRDRHVVIYAVNNEFDSTINCARPWSAKPWMPTAKSTTPLDVLVAVDEAEAIRKAFCGEILNGEAVVIDKDGIVRAVELSGVPGLKRKLKCDLDAVFAGK